MLFLSHRRSEAARSSKELHTSSSRVRRFLWLCHHFFQTYVKRKMLRIANDHKKSLCVVTFCGSLLGAPWRGCAWSVSCHPLCSSKHPQTPTFAGPRTVLVRLTTAEAQQRDLLLRGTRHPQQRRGVEQVVVVWGLVATLFR